MAKTETKTTEVIDQETGEVTNVPAPAEGKLPAATDGPSMLSRMAQDAVKDRQKFEADDLIIPRVTILQDLSDQVKENNAQYVKGARPGMIYNSATKTLSQACTFIPAIYAKRYPAWRPNRGGLLAMDTDRALLTDHNQTGIGEWRIKFQPKFGDVDPDTGKPETVTAEVLETPDWVGLFSVDGKSFTPCVISFPKTHSKAAREISTAINLCEVEGPDGPFTPPAYAHLFDLSIGMEKNDKNEWWAWKVTRLGWNENERLYDRAKELRHSFLSGDVEVESE